MPQDSGVIMSPNSLFTKPSTPSEERKFTESFFAPRSSSMSAYFCEKNTDFEPLNPYIACFTSPTVNTSAAPTRVSMHSCTGLTS